MKKDTKTVRAANAVAAAKRFVLSRQPNASVISRENTIGVKIFTVIDNTRYRGAWMSGSHSTEEIAWIVAARSLRRKEKSIR